jgi:hypothetical protein
VAWRRPVRDGPGRRARLFERVGPGDGNRLVDLRSVTAHPDGTDHLPVQADRHPALRAPAGPGIEFLEYRTPRDGRPRPVDTRPNDLMQTRLVSDDAGAVARAIRGSACAMLSPGLVAPAERALGFAKGFLLRDPDGHALEVVEP